MAGRGVERCLAAVLATDVAGDSCLMGVDEVGTPASLKKHRREVVDPAIAAHNGRIVKKTGDGRANRIRKCGRWSDLRRWGSGEDAHSPSRYRPWLPSV